MKSRMAAGGFTLMEILVAVAVFSIVMLTLFSSFNAFTATNQRLAEAVHASSRQSIVINRFRQDLQMLFMIRPPRFSPPDINDDPDLFRFEGSSERVGTEMFSRISFATLSGINRIGEASGGVFRVAYYVRERSDGTFDLCRFQAGIGDKDIQASCNDPVVARNIEGFDLAFLGSGTEKTQAWNSDQERDQYRMPDLITMKLVFKGTDENAGEQASNTVETAFECPVNREKM